MKQIFEWLDDPFNMTFASGIVVGAAIVTMIGMILLWCHHAGWI